MSDDEIPVLQKPVTANCGTKSGLCSFAYSTSVTPVIMSFEVSLFYMWQFNMVSLYLSEACSYVLNVTANHLDT